jgi:transcriptional regulator with GAF, ATPase, and Fis domain
VVIGRKPEGERAIWLDDDEASRTHAAVEYDAPSDSWTLVDRSSRNGTFVDGARVDRAPLRHGTIVRIGRALLAFVDVGLTPGMPLVPESPELLGEGLSMMGLRGEIARVGPQLIPVLVLGETGVGKERVAYAVHAASKRSGAFVAVNCAALPGELAESELFGHVAGAFTGASARSEGLFAAAHGGTLFLDEVGELPATVQAKLLRALATGEVRPVGRAEAQRHDVRVVAATNRDLERDVASGTFRADLFARLSGWTLHVPPLRAHKEDVLRLAKAFLARARPSSAAGLSISTSAGEALLLYDFPYNVRELEQLLAAAVVRAEGESVLRTVHLPPAVAQALTSRRPAARTSSLAPEAPLDVLVDRARVPDAEELGLVFERMGGNVTLVAQFFGRDRRQVYRWLARAGIGVAELREAAEAAENDGQAGQARRDGESADD